MIIFDLDGTLADCEHRRHFIKPPENVKFIYEDSVPYKNGCILTGNWYERESNKIWKPDWQSFYEACDKDVPNEAVKDILLSIHYGDQYFWQIWSGRCESFREKTLSWLDTEIFSNSEAIQYIDRNLKMRPVGDNTPDDQIKERWLEQSLSEGKKIDFVFDDGPKSIKMWRRRGIFVFNCSQHNEEF